MNDETVNPLKPINLKYLKEMENIKRKERLENGLKINKLTIKFKKSNFTIQFWNENENQRFYEVDLEECTNDYQLLDKIFQLKKRIQYIDEAGLIYGFLIILDNVCIEVFEKDSRELFQYGGFKLDWLKCTYTK